MFTARTLAIRAVQAGSKKRSKRMADSISKTGPRSIRVIQFSHNSVDNFVAGADALF
jgi:tRNA G26 N,N-dimethylase Trm1